MGSCVLLSEIVLKNIFWAKNKNQHPILNPCAKFELNTPFYKNTRQKAATIASNSDSQAQRVMCATKASFPV